MASEARRAATPAGIPVGMVHVHRVVLRLYPAEGEGDGEAEREGDGDGDGDAESELLPTSPDTARSAATPASESTALATPPARTQAPGMAGRASASDSRQPGTERADHIWAEAGGDGMGGVERGGNERESARSSR